jgi:hypothetical protein
LLSIILPSVRDISRFVASIDDALAEPYELIVVSPEHKDIPWTQHQVQAKCVVDKGSPSRCLQRGISLAEGPVFTWGTDDGVYLPTVLRNTVQELRGYPKKDGMIVMYTEQGPGAFTGANPDYYVSKNHEANRQPGINPEWKIAPVGMFYTDYFREIGGIDCRFEHINMNIHDFVYRLQKDGGELHYSDGVAMHCDSNNWGPEHRILDDAYNLNDLPLFKSLYVDDSREVKIDFDNWKESPEVWRRFE